MLRTEVAPAQARAGATFIPDATTLPALPVEHSFPGFYDVHNAGGTVEGLIGREWTYDDRRLRVVAGSAIPVSVERLEAWSFVVSPGTLALAHRAALPIGDLDDWHNGIGTSVHRGASTCACSLCVASELVDVDDDDDDHPAGVITHWSRRSRARMVRALAELDHDSWDTRDPFAMVTLTLPGDWLTVARTGADFKRHYRALVRRFQRATGSRWQACWKLEFQERGAPHFHLLMRPPASVEGQRFELWLSSTWADIVDHPDPLHRMRHEAAGTNVDFGYRATDPKRVAVYFLKHSAKTLDNKEYQHTVPAEWSAPGTGPGRFWGVTGVASVRSTVDVDRHTFYRVRRILRDLERANRARTALARRSHALARGEWQGEPVDRLDSLQHLGRFGRRSKRLLNSSTGGGWVMLNDAPHVAIRLAAFLYDDARTGPPLP